MKSFEFFLLVLSHSTEEARLVAISVTRLGKTFLQKLPKYDYSENVTL